MKQVPRVQSQRFVAFAQAVISAIDFNRKAGSHLRLEWCEITARVAAHMYPGDVRAGTHACMRMEALVKAIRGDVEHAALYSQGELMPPALAVAGAVTRLRRQGQDGDHRYEFDPAEFRNEALKAAAQGGQA